MKRHSNIDPENPSPQASDWIGAWVLEAGERRRLAIPGGVTFHIFRASTNPDLFIIADRKDPPHLPECPGRGEWCLFKVMPETGQRRVGFVETKAKADIAEHGYHAVRVRGSGTEVVPARELAPARARRRVKRS